jgi:hypothetical protein
VKIINGEIVQDDDPRLKQRTKTSSVGINNMLIAIIFDDNSGNNPPLFG